MYYLMRGKRWCRDCVLTELSADLADSLAPGLIGDMKIEQLEQQYDFVFNRKQSCLDKMEGCCMNQ